MKSQLAITLLLAVVALCVGVTLLFGVVGLQWLLLAISLVIFVACTIIAVWRGLKAAAETAEDPNVDHPKGAR